MYHFHFKNLVERVKNSTGKKRGVTCSFLPTTENHMFPPLFKILTGKPHTLAPTELRTPPLIPESVQNPRTCADKSKPPYHNRQGD